MASANSVNPNYVASAHPSPVVVSALPTPAPATTGQIHAAANSSSSAPVGGSATGWSAVGGSPIIVGESDNLDGLSRRYGVPTAALMSANGLSSPSQVHGGMRLVVPVYTAGAKRTAEAPEKPASIVKPKKAEVAEAETPKAAKRKAEKAKADATADISDAKSKTKKAPPKLIAQAAPTTLAPGPHALAKPDKAEKTKTAAAAAPVPAPAAPKVASKKQEIDKAPVAAINPTAQAAPITSQQADASGASPEFRWPARGRIIQGFKSGGNDGINISVPEGTSVRAAEDGKVAYAGSALKGYGNLVLIRHPNGFVTAYANNGELNVKSGDTVKRGQVIAKSGQSGDVSSPQLHFELRKGSTPVDPTSYLAGL